jgi:SPP1 family predicted phage head-tail adaptor
MTLPVFESLLNHEASIARRRRSPDGQGGWAIDYAPHATARGRIRPAGSAEREAAQAEQREISHVLYVLADVDIARGDRVTVDGLTVDVVGVREPSKAGEFYQVDCLEKQVEENEPEVGS